MSTIAFGRGRGSWRNAGPSPGGPRWALAGRASRCNHDGTHPPAGHAPPAVGSAWRTPWPLGPSAPVRGPRSPRRASPSWLWDPKTTRGPAILGAPNPALYPTRPRHLHRPPLDDPARSGRLKADGNRIGLLALPLRRQVRELSLVARFEAQVKGPARLLQHYLSHFRSGARQLLAGERMLNPGVPRLMPRVPAAACVHPRRRRRQPSGRRRARRGRRPHLFGGHPRTARKGGPAVGSAQKGGAMARRLTAALEHCRICMTQGRMHSDAWGLSTGVRSSWRIGAGSGLGFRRPPAICPGVPMTRSRHDHSKPKRSR